MLKATDHRQARNRARWRANSKRYRERNPKRGPCMAVLRMAANIERIRTQLIVAGFPLRGATRHEIELAWAQFNAELYDDLEAGKIFRHR